MKVFGQCFLGLGTRGLSQIFIKLADNKDRHNISDKVDFYPVSATITKTCLYNFYPLKPHFYLVKLGFTGIYVIFLISPQSIECGYSLEPHRRGGSKEYPQSMI